MSATKTIKKGEFLFRENDKIQSLYIIQSGAISACLARPKKNVDIFQVGPSHILGEQALSGASAYPYSAIALQESVVIEMPIDILKQQVETSQQTVKVLVKSLNERLKTANLEIKSNKLEKDTSPAPEDQVAKIFGCLFHAAKHKGEVKDKTKPDIVTVDWLTLRQYAQRVFGESPKRLEQSCTLLIKMKLAQFEMGRPPEDPEGPEQIMKVQFFNLPVVEAFFEFYQYYYYKSGKSEVLKVDEAVMNHLQEILKLAASETPDRVGIVTLDYTKTIEGFKQDLGINLNKDHFARMEQKGVYTKRATRSDGATVLQFEKKEFENLLQTWKFLREIDKWNEKGFVDLTDVDVKPKKKTDGPSCTQCGAGVDLAAKFCSACGAKVSKAS